MNEFITPIWDHSVASPAPIPTPPHPHSKENKEKK